MASPGTIGRSGHQALDYIWPARLITGNIDEVLLFINAITYLAASGRGVAFTHGGRCYGGRCTWAFDRPNGLEIIGLGIIGLTVPGVVRPL